MPNLIVNLGFRRVKFKLRYQWVTTVQKQPTVRPTLHSVAKTRATSSNQGQLLHMGQLLSL